jgi:ligand-binding SRPBCC domain-containing protein
MADHLLEGRIWLPRPRREVFAFFADPANLPAVNPPSARLRWLAPPPPVLETGAVLDFSVRWAGLPTRWRVLVREFDPPYRFVDVQLRGPFSKWEHRHRFREAPESEDRGGPIGTWVEDHVRYQLPGGALGRVAHAWGARRAVRWLFDHRARRLREIFAP